jgi:alkanesulfonate monooxygenase SsuD/methylene tetrahydromethanopterin reductase-like flavin-dependent oxidoreductase (luciferase family)
MEGGLHLPLIDFAGEGLSRGRLFDAVDAAREAGFTVVSANDHLLFPAPWLDGPTALAAVVERSGGLQLATTLSLATLRGPVALVKTLTGLDILSGGRLVAGVGPGSSAADYAALGVPFDERWSRFEESVSMLRALLDGGAVGAGRHYPAPATTLTPLPVQSPLPIWVGSWGTPAGLRRVARLGDGWLASAHNSTPEAFAERLGVLGEALRKAGRSVPDFPHALVTMWSFVTDSTVQADRVLREVLGPLLRRDPEDLRDQVCVGPAERCVDLLSRYARAGCRRVHFWPVGDERRQVELLAERVLPLVHR